MPARKGSKPKKPFEKGHEKKGGRQRGVKNKKIMNRQYYAELIDNARETFDLFLRYFKMPVGEFRAITENVNARDKMSLKEWVTMRIVSSATMDNNVVSMRFVMDKVFGAPADYIGRKSLNFEEEKIIDRINKFDSEITMDWLIKWTAAHTLEFVGNDNHLSHFLQVAKLLGELIKSRDALNYVKSNVLTLDQVQRVLDVVSDSLTVNLADKPDAFDQVKDDIIERINGLDVFGGRIGDAGENVIPMKKKSL